MSAAPPLELRGIVKRFADGTLAVDGVDLTLAAGEIHALCGENGAGKSTLARIGAGTLAPTSGQVLRAATVGLVHQHAELAGRLRVWENVVLGREPRRALRLDAGAARELVRRLAEAYGLAIDPDAIAETLSARLAQRVEILREVARAPRALLLDEPTAVLAPGEVEPLFATLRALAARGTAVLVITHKLEEIRQYADRVTVMRAGRIVLRTGPREASVAELARAMVGGEVPPLAERARAIPRPAFAARGVCTSGAGAAALQPTTFEVRGGEIVGIAGVEGNGQAALCDAIAGLVPYRGEMALCGELLPVGRPAARLARGVRVIPADRQREGLVLGWTIVDNVVLGERARSPLGPGLIDRRAAAMLAEAIVARFDVKTRSIRTLAAALSGGNQQKVVVGKALAHAPAFVVAQEPTRGVDVGAAALLRSRLIEARNAGMAVLLVSSELEELFALSDRMLVMYRGAVAGQFAREAFERERIGMLMAGAA